MGETWTLPIARIRHQSGATVGTGVLIIGDLVLTCAHVIEAALKGRNVEAEEGVHLPVDFPFAGIHAVDFEIKYISRQIPEAHRRRDSTPSDIAVLAVTNRDQVAAISPVYLAENDAWPSHSSFSCRGFCQPNTALAEGTLQGLDGGGWIQAVAQTDLGHFIEPGFSGAPVFAGQGEAVDGREILGICATADNRRTGLLIPPAHLANAARKVLSPYRWLAAFEERDAVFFFGRQHLCDELWSTLKERQFALLAGGSGSGKSSILRAGLAANARRDGCRTVIVRPLGSPFLQLARGLGLTDYVGGSAIRSAVEDQALNGLFIGVDQAEELLLGPDLEVAREFLDLLDTLYQDPYLRGKLYIVLAARSDSLPLLLSVQPDKSRLLEKNLRYLDPLGREEMRAAIELPARRLRVRFTPPQLVDRIVNDVLESQVSLPILQLCLSKLWQMRTNDGPIQKEAYDDLGGVKGALAKQASDDLKSEQIPMLAPLVEVARKGGRHRRRVPMTELDWPAQQLFWSLEKSRLVVISRDRVSGQDLAELAHDSLLTEWSPLAHWVEEHGDFLLWRQKTLEDAEAWRSRGEGYGLYTGARLSGALEWLQKESHQLSDDEGNLIRAFVSASEGQREKEEHQKLWRERELQGSLLAFLAEQETARGNAVDGMLLALHGLPPFAANPDRPANARTVGALIDAMAEQRELSCWNGGELVGVATGNAMALSKTPPLLYAALSETVRCLDTAESIVCDAWPAKAHHVQYNPRHCGLTVDNKSRRLITVRSYMGVDFWDIDSKNHLKYVSVNAKNAVRLAVNESEGLLAAGSEDHSVYLIDTVSMSVVGSIGAGGCVFATAFSRTGSWLASALEDHIKIWAHPGGWRSEMSFNIRRPCAMAKLEGYRRALAIAFSPDNAWLAAAYRKGVLVWQITEPGEPTETIKLSAVEIEGLSGSANAIAFSPSGALVAAGYADGTIRLVKVSGERTVERLTAGDHPVADLIFADEDRLLSLDLKGTIRSWAASPRYRLPHRLEPVDPDRRWLRDCIALSEHRPGWALSKGRVSPNTFMSPEEVQLFRFNTNGVVCRVHRESAGFLDPFYGSCTELLVSEKFADVMSKEDALHSAEGWPSGADVNTPRPEVALEFDKFARDVKPLASRDGRTIIGATAAGRIMIWHDGKLFASWKVSHQVVQLQLSADDRIAMARLANGEVRLWNIFISLQDLVAEARLRLPRQLTLAEAGGFGLSPEEATDLGLTPAS